MINCITRSIMNMSDALKWLNETNDNEETKAKTCFITKEPIKDGIVLKCGHEYEYDALYSHYKVAGEGTSTHTCPYCRKTFKYFIPYYESSSVVSREKINLIHHNKYLNCQYVFSQGKKKGCKCNHYAHRFLNGTFCTKHRSQRKRAPKIQTDNIPICTQTLCNGKPCSYKVYDNTSMLCKRHFNLKQKKENNNQLNK